MKSDDIVSLTFTFIAIIVSIFAASSLEKRLKARTPATRPYRWGFFVGCLGLAWAPLALVAAFGTLLAGIHQRWQTFGFRLAFTVFLTVHVFAGFFIIQRKRWAWVVGTIVSLNPVLWAINYAYGSKRWRELAGQPYGSAGTEDEGYDLLADATNLETQGRIQEALAAYQRVADNYSHTSAGHDAQKSIETLRAKLG